MGLNLSPELHRTIAALSPNADDRDIKEALKALFREALPPDEHERCAEHIRRLTRLSRGTFKRLMKHTQSPKVAA